MGHMKGFSLPRRGKIPKKHYLCTYTLSNNDMRHLSFLLAALLAPTALSAQYAWQYDAEAGPLAPGRDILYKVEAQGSLSEGRTPLWLNANRHGLSSLDEANGYLRAQAIRPLRTDSARRWGVGYGLDVAVATGYTSTLVVQQAFVEARWLHGVVSIGAKEYPMELKNNRLSSGAQTLGINARPVPQVRLALPHYWTIPALGRWLHVKGHVAYGRMTDDNWQHEFTARQSKYADNVRYHSKAGYLKIGSDDRFVPLSVEVGLEMATLFGGTSHAPNAEGRMVATPNASGLKSYLKALVPGGADAPEQGTVYQNEEGDILGSWVMRVNYDTDAWRLGVYADKFFEDHSSMLSLDYDGYGEGSEWNTHKRHHYFLYDLKDWMLGGELNLKYGTWLRDIVLEYVYTKYQSGPIYHDHSPGRQEHVSGIDNYYNHYIFTGWQHWGQAIGSPLYRSPIYNDNGQLRFENNRFVAWHLGFGGQPTERLAYRVLATRLTGYGTYDNPYDRKHHATSLMVEADYRLPRQWNVRGAVGLDFGEVYGYNRGFQLTISKSGIFSL